MQDWIDRLLARAYWPIIGVSILLSLIAIAAAAGMVPQVVVQFVGWGAAVPCALLFTIQMIDPLAWRRAYRWKDVPNSFNFFPRLFAAKDGNRLMLAIGFGLWLEFGLVMGRNLLASILVFEAFWLVGVWLRIKFQRLPREGEPSSA